MPRLPMPFQAVQEMIEAQPSVLEPLAGGVGGLSVARAVYDFTVDGGAIATITPVETVTLPLGAVLVGGIVFAAVAVTSLGSATVAVGTTAGSSTTALLAATAKASLSLNAVLPLVPTNAVPVRLTAAGAIDVTVAAAALTAGKLEIFVFYVQPGL
jgi:hypothetical protein